MGACTSQKSMPKKYRDDPGASLLEVYEVMLHNIKTIRVNMLRECIRKPKYFKEKEEDFSFFSDFKIASQKIHG